MGRGVNVACKAEGRGSALESKPWLISNGKRHINREFNDLGAGIDVIFFILLTS